MVRDSPYSRSPQNITDTSLHRSAYKVILPNRRRSGSIISTALMPYSAYAIVFVSHVSQKWLRQNCSDGPRRGFIIITTRNGTKRVPCNSYERESTRVVRVLLVHLLGCCLTLYSYDFFKAELLKTRFFKDDIYCHFTASFAAVRILMGDVSHV